MKMIDAMLIALGMALIAWGALPMGWSRRRHEARLRNRLERGCDRYHDELRALEAYRPEQRRTILCGIGAALLAVGLKGWLAD